MLSSIWVLSLSMIGADVAPAEPAPVRLVMEQQGGGGVRLRVVGESDVRFRGGYSLQVESDAAAGGNRTVQRGTVDLRPGIAETLMTLTLGPVGAGSWTARLRVDPADGDGYEQVRHQPER